MPVWKYAIFAALASSMTMACSTKPNVRCGQGTVLQNRTCVAQIRCGEGTVEQDGACVSTAVIESKKNSAMFDQAIADLQSVADKTCACKDRACLVESDRAMEELGRKYADIRAEDMNEATMKRVQDVAMKMATCRMELEEKLGGGKSDGAKLGSNGGAGLTIGVAECDALIASYLGCESIPQKARDEFMESVGAWSKSIEDNGDEAKKALGRICADARKSAKPLLESHGCK